MSDKSKFNKKTYLAMLDQKLSPNTGNAVSPAIQKLRDLANRFKPQKGK